MAARAFKGGVRHTKSSLQIQSASFLGTRYSARNLSTREKAVIRRQTLDQFLRVDHAGEYGADRIYAGQAAILGRDLSTEENRRIHNLINHMWEQEKEHLRTFKKLIPENQARPTILLPLWHVAGYVLGAGSALIGGTRGAMTITVAVEACICLLYTSPSPRDS